MIDTAQYISMNGLPLVCSECDHQKGYGHDEKCSHYNFPIKAKFETPKDCQDRQAWDALYNTFIEIGEILERGIKDGEKGYKNAIYKAREKIRLVT